MKEEVEAKQSEEYRVKHFVRYMKAYGGFLSLATASLPIPLSYIRWMPAYRAHWAFLSAFTSLFCFLLLGFVFYNRHQLARWLFPEFLSHYDLPDRNRKVLWFLKKINIKLWHLFLGLLPLILILSSLVCLIQYRLTLGQSVVVARAEAMLESRQMAASGGEEELRMFLGEIEKAESRGDKASVARHWLARMRNQAQISESGILDQRQNDIPFEWSLLAFYFAVFMTAEGAFVLMGTKEYLQDAVGLTEMQAIRPGVTVYPWH